MKKGFTLSESLISLAIIGVISAVLIPVLNSVRPDQDRIMYKKAMYTMQNALATAMNESLPPAANSDAFWADSEVPATGKDSFCESIAGSLNVVGNVSCGGAGDATAPNFTTVNGAKWWGLGGSKFSVGGTKDITVDVNGNGGDNAAGIDQLRMKVGFDGRVTTDPTWTTENDYLSDALKVQK